MIGDWVQSPDGLDKITALCAAWAQCMKHSYGYREIQPIPLIAEILEKNGFEECANGDWTNDNVDFILYRRKDGIFRIQNTNMTLPYVSSFQHALRLCGIDKEIKL